MISEDTKKWLEYQQRGVKPTRYKRSAIVFSSHSIAVPVHFELNGLHLSLLPFASGERPVGSLEGYGPAFRCEIISQSSVPSSGDDVNIQEALDRVLPLLGFDYRLPIEYQQWEEYDGQWLSVLGVAMSASMLLTHPDIPQKTNSIVAAYERLSGRKDKRSKKTVAIRSRLKEAVRLEDISRRYSFLSYYSIIEIVSDDLAAAKDCPSGDSIAQEIANYSLSTKGSQRTKIYFLLRAIPNEFNISSCVEIADIRNNIAHGEMTVSPEHFDLCKKIAFWASDAFVLKVAE